MARVFKEVEVKGDLGKVEVKALFDTGASRTIIKKEIAKRIASLIELPKPRTITLGDEEHKIEVKEIIGLVINIDGYFLTTDADVSEKLAHSLIIGASTMQQWGIVIDPGEEKVIIKEPRTSFELL
jgi:predicted aspartyl protease